MFTTKERINNIARKFAIKESTHKFKTSVDSDFGDYCAGTSFFFSLWALDEEDPELSSGEFYFVVASQYSVLMNGMVFRETSLGLPYLICSESELLESCYPGAGKTSCTAIIEKCLPIGIKLSS